MNYRQNFLTKVILKLDFPENADVIGNAPLTLTEEIREDFPRSSINPVSLISVKVGPNAPGVEQETKGYEHIHTSKKEDKRILVNPTSLSLIYEKGAFSLYPAFREEFEKIFNAFCSDTNIAEFSRIGLRFINEIVISEGDALDWGEYIADELANSITSGRLENYELMRSMHQLHFRDNEACVLFNYGIHNADYPEPVVRREFILDYDVYKRAEIEQKGVMSLVDDFNRVCETMFETSIKDDLRELMGVEDGQ